MILNQEQPTQMFKSWISTSLAKLFESRGFLERLDEGVALLKDRRVLDFVVVSGSFCARVYSKNRAPSRVEVRLPQLDAGDWDKAFSELAKKALYLAELLAGGMSKDISKAFELAGVKLLPENSDAFGFFINDKEVSELSPEIAAIIYRFCDKLVADPFLLLTFRGRGREESILEVRKHREELKQSAQSLESDEDNEETVFKSKSKTATYQEYWCARKEMQAISYSIKADELPSSILKWLDLPPLAGLEHEAEPLLEEAYEKITCRAQAYGLGL